jgi:small subunit ribosomal protein S1
VTRVEPFGAFVEVAPGVEGLLHISELGANRQLRHAREAVKAGESIDVAVLAVDPEKRRISLGLAEREAGVDVEGRAAAVRASGAGQGLGTLGDLLKGKLPGR